MFAWAQTRKRKGLSWLGRRTDRVQKSDPWPRPGRGCTDTTRGRSPRAETAALLSRHLGITRNRRRVYREPTEGSGSPLTHPQAPTVPFSEDRNGRALCRACPGEDGRQGDPGALTPSHSPLPRRRGWSRSVSSKPITFKVGWGLRSAKVVICVLTRNTEKCRLELRALSPSHFPPPIPAPPPPEGKCFCAQEPEGHSRQEHTTSRCLLTCPTASSGGRAPGQGQECSAPSKAASLSRQWPLSAGPSGRWHEECPPILPGRRGWPTGIQLIEP